MPKSKLIGFAKKIRMELINPAFGFSGMLKHLADQAHSLAYEAEGNRFLIAASDYRKLRRKLDKLAAEAKKKGL